MTTIDTTGFSCPQPMLMVKKAMDTMKTGTLTALADAEASRENITRAASALGWQKTSETVDNGIYTMVFTSNN